MTDLRRYLAGAIKWTLIVLLLAWSLTPILWNIATSLKVRAQIFEYPPVFFFRPTTDGYEQALGQQGIYPQLQNSLVIATTTTLLTLTFGLLAAYAFSRYEFPGRKPFMYSLIAARLLPPISAVGPLYTLASDMNLIDTQRVLILIYTALNIPFAAWLLKSYVDTIPKELEEAAALEGCGAIRTLRHITIPLMKGGLLATGTFVFVLAWNEFMFAFMFTVVRARTLPVILAESRGDETVLWQLLTAQATILMVPTVILGLFLQKYLVRGLTAGAVR